MWQNFFTILIIIFWASIPIILWGYLFSYFWEGMQERKKFFLWIFAWIVSVFPVLILKEFWTQFQEIGINIFTYIANLANFQNYFWAFVSLCILLFLVSVFPFLISFQNNYKLRGKIFWRNLLIFGWFFIVLLWIFFLGEKFFDIFSGLDVPVEKNLSVWDVVFNSLKLVLFYYCIIALIEELSKFFCFKYSKYFSITSVKDGVLFAMFVALGFAFLENILYFYSVYSSQWATQSLVGIYISRNIFSLILHVLCSSVFAYFFTQAYLKYHNSFDKNFLKILGKWFLLALFLHAGFNIFLTLDMTFMIFLYVIGSYFTITYFFYEAEEN
jgi:RsiW-degrading membrane proteinase PrsW (M82 family)